MIRKLKVLSLAIAAVLAVSALGASTASAAEFHSEAEKTTITGAQTTQHKFTTDPGTVTCKTATFSGSTSAKTVTDIEIIPIFKECTLATIFGNIAVTVDFKGCYFTLTSHINSATVHIVCPPTIIIIIVGPGCTVSVPPQTLGGITYTNNGAGASRDINLDINSSGIQYSYSGFTCGSGTNTTNGTYTGAATVQGSAGIWWE